MNPNKRYDALNIASELYSIWGNKDRREAFDKFLKFKYCEEPWLCWLSISTFLEWIRNDTIGGVKQRNTSYIEIVYNYVDDKGDGKYIINIAEQEFKNKLIDIMNKLKGGNDNEFDIRPIFELQAKAEILLAENLKTFLIEDKTFEFSKGKQIEGTIVDNDLDLHIISLFELQSNSGKLKKIYKKTRCVLNSIDKSLIIYNPDRETFLEGNVIDLKYVRFIITDDKEKIKPFEIQYLTPTSQRIFYFRAPQSIANSYSKEISMIIKERDEKIRVVEFLILLIL